MENKVIKIIAIDLSQPPAKTITHINRGQLLTSCRVGRKGMHACNMSLGVAFLMFFVVSLVGTLLERSTLSGHVALLFLWVLV